MNKKNGLMITCFCILIFAWNASAQPTHIEYDFSGTGNFLISPVVYSGTIDAGEPLLVGGTWDLIVDDTGWPPDTDKPVRWDYINNTYFAPNYDPGFGSWVAIFNSVTTASDLIWHDYSLYGTLYGTAELQVTLFDFDFDQVIDPDERAFSIFSGTLIVVKDGTGIWTGYCGLGSFSGSSTNPDPANWADDSVSGNTILDIQLCQVPTDDVSWGHIKKIYSSE